MKLKSLIVVIILWLIVINTGSMGTPDTEFRLRSAHALWTGIEETNSKLPPLSSAEAVKNYFRLDAGVTGIDGRRYSPYEPGQSFLMLPGDFLATKLNQVLPFIHQDKFSSLVVSYLIFIPINLAVVLASFWLICLLGFDRKVAKLSVLIWFLGTTVLFYSQVHHENNQLLLFTLLGYACALAYIQKRRFVFASLSGLFLGLDVLIRTTSIIHVFTVFLFFSICWLGPNKSFSGAVKSFGFWILGFLPPTLFGRWWDYRRFGSYLLTASTAGSRELQNNHFLMDKYPNFPFSNPPSVGIWGVLFSPCKSIFIYDPLLLPSFILLFWSWKRLNFYTQVYILTNLLNLGIHIVFTSRLIFWHGDMSWAARYHVTSVHLLLIPLIPLFIQYLLALKGLKAWIIKAIVVFAIFVQLCSVVLINDLEGMQVLISEHQIISFWKSDKLSNQFRLGQRMINIICLVEPNFSNTCINSPKNLDIQNLGIAGKDFTKNHNGLVFTPFTLIKSMSDRPFIKFLSPFIIGLWIFLFLLAILKNIEFYKSVLRE